MGIEEGVRELCNEFGDGYSEGHSSMIVDGGCNIEDMRVDFWDAETVRAQSGGEEGQAQVQITREGGNSKISIGASEENIRSIGKNGIELNIGDSRNPHEMVGLFKNL